MDANTVRRAASSATMNAIRRLNADFDSRTNADTRQQRAISNQIRED